MAVVFRNKEGREVEVHEGAVTTQAILARAGYRQVEAPAPQKAATEPEEPGLEALDGVGEELAETLREHGFEDVAALRDADVEALTAVPGIGEKLAKRIVKQVKDGAEILRSADAPRSVDPAQNDGEE